MLQELECIRVGFPFVCVWDRDLFSLPRIMNTILPRYAGDTPGQLKCSLVFRKAYQGSWYVLSFYFKA